MEHLGKSYLIHTVTKSEYKPNVLLLAFPGVAASLIGGTTFHTGIGFKYGCEYLPLIKEKREAT